MKTHNSRTLLFFLFLPWLTLATLHVEPPPPPPQEKLPPPLPEVGDLKPGFFEDAFDLKGEKLSEQFQAFQNELEKQAKALPPEEQKKADELLNKIAFTLHAYETSISQALPPKPTAGTIASHYTIDELVNVYRNLRREKVELTTSEREKTERDEQIQGKKRILARVRGDYDKAEKRSESRLLLGLEWISLASSIALEEVNLAFVEQSVETNKLELAFYEEELRAALSRIVSSELDLFIFAKQVKVKEKAWEEAKERLKNAQIIEAKSISENIAFDDSLLHQKLLQEVETAAINETLAHCQYLFAEVQLGLAELTSKPEDALDLDTLRKNAKSWQELLNLFEQRTKEWQIQAERQIKRSTQAIDAKDGQNSKEVQAHEEIIKIAQNNLLLLQQLGNTIEETHFLLKELDKQISKAIGGSRRWIQESLDQITDSFTQTNFWLSKELFVIGKNPVTLMALIRFFFIIIATFWISKIAMQMLLRFGKRRYGVKKAVIYRVTRLCYYLLLAIGLLIALTSLGFDFSNFLLVAGALGVGLGFGLQSIFNNFISGIIILFESHLKVGDYIELESGLRGEVREINVRSTVITDNDGIDVLVPNSEIINSKVLNWTLKVPYRRVQVPFTVAYGSDKDLVAKVIKEAAMEVAHTLTKVGVPEPVVRLTKLGDYGLEFELVVWVKEKYTRRSRATRSDYLWAIESALSKNHIAIPYPQIDLHFRPSVEEKEKNK